MIEEERVFACGASRRRSYSSIAEAPLGTPQTGMDRRATAALAAVNDTANGDTIAALHRFALDMAGPSDLDELLKSALLAAARLTGAAHATVLLLDEQGQQIRYRVALDNGNLAPLDLVAGPMMSRGLAGWVARERQAALIPDTEQDSRWLPGPGLGDLRSAVVAPLLCYDRMLGMITLGHEAPGHFTPNHLRLLEIVCAPIALAVDHARLMESRADAPHAWPGQPEPAVCEVVALSAELRGLTGAAAKLAPAALFGEVLDVYLQTMDEIVRQHAGILDNIAGDTLLAIFSRAERAAADAVQAAMAMRAGAQRLCAEWRARQGISMGSLDIGIALGSAAIGSLSTRPGAGHAVGEVLGAATRLRELARSGEILVSSAVAAALDAGTFTVEALQPLRLRDAAPQQIFRIDTRN
jgi:class 3 adenylate cyclase